MNGDKEKAKRIIFTIKEHCKTAVTEVMHKDRIIEILFKAYPTTWGEVLIEITKKLRAAIDAVE